MSSTLNRRIAELADQTRVACEKDVCYGSQEAYGYARGLYAALERMLGTKPPFDVPPPPNAPAVPADRAPCVEEDATSLAEETPKKPATRRRVTA